jgi:hypothetical protein
MKTVFRLLLTLVVFLPVRLFAGKYEPPKPIVTPAELAAAAAEVPVMRLDFTLPEEKNALESSDALSKRFFNTPEEMRYGGVTSTDWRKKWDLFAKALIDKAANNKLDASSLEKCLTALNHGRTKQTMNGVVDLSSFENFKKTKEEIEKQEKEAKLEREKREKDQEDHPERYYDETLAIVPVGAYLAKYAKGDCWIIICKWESFFEKQPAVGLGHIMVWAMDAKTCSIVAYVTCD